jgi:predicted ATP-dependent Lon-type protease
MANYNLVELGPRETGKSFGYQQLSGSRSSAWST